MSQNTMASLVEEINHQLDEIRVIVNDENLASSTLLKTKNKLDDVLALLNNQTPTGANINLKCVSRDNDGAAPYQLGILNPRTLTIEKIKGAVIRSLEVCEKVIEKTKRTSRNLFAVCVSRDNDGSAPWSYALIGQTTDIIKISSFRQIEDCIDGLDNTLMTRFALAVCASRDNDGAAPFAKYVYSFETQTLLKQETYSSIKSCQENLQ